MFPDRQTDRITVRHNYTLTYILSTYWYVDRQTDRQTDRITVRQTDRQTGRQADRQYITVRHNYTLTDWYADRQTDWHLRAFMYMFIALLMEKEPDQR